MYVPKALFNKDKIPAVSTPVKKPEKVVGMFIPPVATEAKVPVKQTSAPKPLFTNHKKTEDDVTATDMLTFKGFSAREIAKIKDQSEKIDLEDRVAVIQYGQEVNKKLANTVDEILNFVKGHSFDAKVAPDVARLHSLINFNPAAVPDEGFFSAFKKKKTLEERINDVISGVDEVTKSVDSSVSYFLTLMPKLDTLLDDCKLFHGDLLILVAAGKERIEQFKRGKLQRLEDQIASNNMMLAQNARDEMNVVDSFAKRVETLELTVGQNELTLAQIRMTQSTNVKMVESLNNIMSNMIPMWKHSLISAITTNNFDAVNKNKDLLAKNICDIMTVKSANAVS
jgi:uncharacterized protein YaaN involved in tellurite resistance